MARLLGPRPNMAFAEQVQAAREALVGCISGEFVATRRDVPLEPAPFDGYITGVWIAAKSGGRDDTNPLKVQADVKINGVSCLSTQPYILCVAGATADNKTSIDAVSGSIVSAVVNQSACAISKGDIITWDAILTRTSTPISEINTPCVVVELESDAT